MLVCGYALIRLLYVRFMMILYQMIIISIARSFLFTVCAQRIGHIIEIRMK